MQNGMISTIRAAHLAVFAVSLLVAGAVAVWLQLEPAAHHSALLETASC